MTALNPLDGFTVDRAAIGYIGHELQRPECILAERDGTLWAADARGGVTRIAADGSVAITWPRVGITRPSIGPRRPLG